MSADNAVKYKSVAGNILAIDTSNEYLSLALEVAGQRYSFLAKVGNAQSQHIIKEIDTLLKQGGIVPSQLDLIAYVAGPGSFTGLRVGLAVAMGIAFGCKARLVPIPSFAVYARAAFDQIQGRLVVGIDARLNQIYLAGINTFDLEYFIQPQVIDPEQIQVEGIFALTGNGFNVYHTRLNSDLRNYPVLALDYPSALYMLDIVRLNKYQPLEVHGANLLYLRNKVAKKLTEQ